MDINFAADGTAAAHKTAANTFLCFKKSASVATVLVAEELAAGALAFYPQAQKFSTATPKGATPAVLQEMENQKKTFCLKHGLFFNSAQAPAEFNDAQGTKVNCYKKIKYTIVGTQNVALEEAVHLALYFSLNARHGLVCYSQEDSTYTVLINNTKVINRVVWKPDISFLLDYDLTDTKVVKGIDANKKAFAMPSLLEVPAFLGVPAKAGGHTMICFLTLIYYSGLCRATGGGPLLILKHRAPRASPSTLLVKLDWGVVLAN